MSVAGFGIDQLPRAALVDASYSDPLLDRNTLLDLDPDEGHSRSQTELANQKLSAVGLEWLSRQLAPAELTALYVRHLYPLIGDAGE